MLYTADNIKKWQIRDGRFLKNFSGHNSVLNCVAVNEDGVCVSGGDNGSICFWDYNTGYNFQSTKTIVQPGMCMRCIYCIVFVMHIV